MRFVDRNSIQPPASLADPTSTAARERQRAKKLYGQTPAPRKAFKFSAYKSADVVAALEQLFNSKCAYCETRMAASQPIDVEHYRPKAAVAEDPTHSGYWWLALEWENLLSSCIDCNRKRKQYLIESPANESSLGRSEKQLAGKQDAFPIRGQIRACKPGDNLELEDALLVDPTKHDPEAHLRWDIAAPSLPIVLPRDTDDEPSIQGDTSIRVYGLNRQRLVEERGRLITDLSVEFEHLRMIFGLIASMEAGAGRESQLSKAVEQLERFRRHGRGAERYSALAQVFVQQCEDQIREEFKEALAGTK